MVDFEMVGVLCFIQVLFVKFYNICVVCCVVLIVCDLFGGNGILFENGVMQYMVDIEVIYIYEGIELVQVLLFGCDIMGMSVFV